MKKLGQSIVKLKPLFKVMLYLFFIFIMINIALAYESLWMRIFVIATMLVVIAFNLLFDHLRGLLEKMQIALTIDCDLEEVEGLRTKFKQTDLLRGMKNDLLLFDVLYLLDQNRPEEVIALINSKEKFFSGQLDYLFIKYHSLLKAYSLLHDKEKANESYEAIDKLRQTSLRKKNKRMNLLYNWDQIDALHALVNHQFNQALQKYKACDTRNMNPRELLHFNYELGSVYKALSQSRKAHECFAEVRRISPKSPFVKEVL